MDFGEAFEIGEETEESLVGDLTWMGLLVNPARSIRHMETCLWKVALIFEIVSVECTFAYCDGTSKRRVLVKQ